MKQRGGENIRDRYRFTNPGDHELLEPAEAREPAYTFEVQEGHVVLYCPVCRYERGWCERVLQPAGICKGAA